MTQYYLNIPDDFLDYEWEVEAKGWLPDVSVTVAQTEYKLQFYDPIRLAQEVTDTLRDHGFFHEKNIVVVQVVNLKNIEDAVKRLVKENGIYPMLKAPLLDNPV